MEDKEKRIGSGVISLLKEARARSRAVVFNCESQILQVSFVDDDFILATADEVYKIIEARTLCVVRVKHFIGDALEVKLSSTGTAAIRTSNLVATVDIDAHTFHNTFTPPSDDVLFALTGATLSVTSWMSSVVLFGENTKQTDIGEEIECMEGNSLWILVVTKQNVTVLSRRLEVLLRVSKPTHLRVHASAIGESCLIVTSKMYTWVFSFVRQVWNTIVNSIDVTSLAVSSKIIAIGLADGTVQGCDFEGNTKFSWKIHQGPITCLCLSPDNQHLVSCSGTWISIMSIQGTLSETRVTIEDEQIRVSEKTRDIVIKWITGTTERPLVSLDEVVRLYVTCQVLVNKKHGRWKDQHREFLSHIPKLYESVAKAKHHGAMMLLVQSLESLLMSFYSLLETE